MRSRSRALRVLLALSLWSCYLLADEHRPPEPTFGVEAFEGWTRATVSVPGKLLSYAVPRSAERSRDIALLVDPQAYRYSLTTDSDDEDDEKPADRLPPCPAEESDAGLSLLRLAPNRGASPVLVRERLDHAYQALDAVDLNGDGTDALLLAREGELFVVESDGERQVVADPGLTWSGLHPRATELPELDGRPLLVTTPMGQLLLFGAVEGSGQWSRLAAADLPVKGQVLKSAVILRNAIPSFVGVRKDGALLYATRPEPFGKQRLQVSLIAVDPRGESSVTDCWSRLPDREDVLEQRFLMLDGQAMLLVSTKPADKLSLFGEKRLRLFRLERDRSRLGQPPVYVAESRMNIWQQGDPILLDVNGDGRRDLVIGYWKGLKDDRVVLDAYLRKSDGWFAAAPKSTAFDVAPAKRRSPADAKPKRPKPDRSFVNYGRDLDGDGLPDLLLRTPVSLLVFRGRNSDNGEKLVDDEPIEFSLSVENDTGETYVLIGGDGFGTWSTGGSGRPRLVDLDRDGAAEILVVTRAARGTHDLLQIFRLER